MIHLDQALARMREYERMKTETESNSNMRCTCRVIEDEDGAAATTTVSNLEGVFLECWELIIKSCIWKLKLAGYSCNHRTQEVVAWGL